MDQIADWNHRLPEGLIVIEFPPDFTDPFWPTHYRWGAREINGSGDWLLAWNTEKQFVAEVSTFRAEHEA